MENGAHRFDETRQDAVRFVVRELKDRIDGRSRLEACFPEHDCADATDLHTQKRREENTTEQKKERAGREESAHG